ncbi:hypothetical protein HUJ04_010790 [Dendroctonus ponderosae]|nr:hypothetical protein HUJ04_010790 [Dendroctonus ponderosae]
MAGKIIEPANCEVRSVIRLLCAKGSSAAEIDRELCLVHGPKAMSVGKVRQWCPDFKNGRANMHDEERSGIQTDEIVSNGSVDKVLKPLRDSKMPLSTGSTLKIPSGGKLLCRGVKQAGAAVRKILRSERRLCREVKHHKTMLLSSVWLSKREQAGIRFGLWGMERQQDH